MQLISWPSVVLLSLSLIIAEEYQKIQVEWSSKCSTQHPWNFECSDLQFPDLNKPALFHLDLAKNTNSSTSLIFEESEFAHFPFGLFENQPWEKVQLGHCFIKKIETKNFEGATFLKELDLTENNLEEIPNSTFSAAVTLEFLKLDKNKISKLYPESLQGLQKLYHLDLGFNQLSDLPFNLFEGLPSLKYLSLSSNQLVSLDAKLFVNNKNLNTINLSENRLEDVPKSIFFGLDNLYGIYLSDNKNLETLELQVSSSLIAVNDSKLKSLKIFGSVERLEVANNLLTSDSIFFDNPSALKDLTIANNSLEQLDFLKPMKNLDLLDLSNHPNLNLKSLNFHFRSLTMVSLRSCQLKTLPIEFLANCVNLYLLDIQDNQMTEIDLRNFFRFKNLHYLEIRRNPWPCRKLEILFRKFIVPKKIEYIRDEIDGEYEGEHRNGIACVNRSDEIPQRSPETFFCE